MSCYYVHSLFTSQHHLASTLSQSDPTKCEFSYFLTLFISDYVLRVDQHFKSMMENYRALCLLVNHLVLSSILLTYVCVYIIYLREYS